MSNNINGSTGPEHTILATIIDKNNVDSKFYSKNKHINSVFWGGSGYHGYFVIVNNTWEKLRELGQAALTQMWFKLLSAAGLLFFVST